MDDLSNKSNAFVVGYWMSQKKLKKLQMPEFVQFCKAKNIILIELNLNHDLSLQGPFHAILHKLTDVWINAEIENNLISQNQWSNVQNFVNSHPEVIIIDPFQSVRQLCDRFLQYSLMKIICTLADTGIDCPNFAVFVSNDIRQNMKKLIRNNISFPIVCKPLQAHGSSFAHMMMLIFCENGLKDVQTPCVAQAFIPHDAILHKLYIMGENYFFLPRPSLKNFTASERKTIFFDSQNISKDGCENELTTLDHLSSIVDRRPPTDRFVRPLVNMISRRTGLVNFGMDLIRESGESSRLLIIDVNAFPDVSCLCCQNKANCLKCDCSANSTNSAITPLFFSFLSEMLVSQLSNPFQNAREFVNHSGDSGIASSESDQSDTGRKCGKLHRNNEEKATTLVPNWGRIKRFYGIPKPAFIRNGNGSNSSLLQFN